MIMETKNGVKNVLSITYRICNAVDAFSYKNTLKDNAAIFQYFHFSQQIPLQDQNQKSISITF